MPTTDDYDKYEEQRNRNNNFERRVRESVLGWIMIIMVICLIIYLIVKL